MTTMTKRDAIESAMSVADNVAQGRLAPADLEAQAVADCRALFGTVAGPGDPLWDLHVDVARQVLALDGVPADELSEWLAVARQRAGEPVGAPDPDETLPEPVALPTVALNPENTEPEPDALAEPEVVVAPEVVAPPMAPPRRADTYDPLAGWSPRGIVR